jgi:hypothetical protein
MDMEDWSPGEITNPEGPGAVLPHRFSVAHKVHGKSMETDWFFRPATTSEAVADWSSLSTCSIAGPGADLFKTVWDCPGSICSISCDSPMSEYIFR